MHTPPRKNLRRVADASLVGFFLLAIYLPLVENGQEAMEALRARNRAHEQNPLYEVRPGDPIIYTLRPNAQGTFPFPKRESAHWNYATNSSGLRGPEIAPKNPGLKRLLFLGDSYTFGWGLDREADAYPRQTEHLLNDDAGTTRAEVINAGIPGYNTVMEYHYLRRALDLFQPDAVVLSYMMNDAEGQSVLPDPAPKFYKDSGFWLYESAKNVINRVVPTKDGLFRPAQDPGKQTFDYLGGFEHGSEKWRASSEALKAMADLCAARHVPFMVFIIPDLVPPLDEPTYYYDAIRRSVASWCRRGGIRFYDLFESFRGMNHLEMIIDPENYPDGENHPTAATHRKMAEVFVRELKTWPELGLK